MASVGGFIYLLGKRPGSGEFTGTGYSKAVMLSYFEYVEFLIFWGDCNGTLRLTAEACDDQAGTNGIEIPFVYQKVEGDAVTPLQEAVEVISEQKTDLAYIITVSEPRLLRSSKSHVRLKTEEQVSGQITGGVLIRVSGGRYS